MSTVGAFLLGIGLFLAAIVLAHSIWFGRKAPRNPWGGATLEWVCSSPPPHDNFSKTPSVGDPYDFHGIEYDPKEGGYVRRLSKG
jgi:cytochrome c oxidase subunit 1